MVGGACLTRSCSGWPQHSGDSSKTLITADVDDVGRLQVIDGSDTVTFTHSERS
jgi:hypothetical protein